MSVSTFWGCLTKQLSSPNLGNWLEQCVHQSTKVTKNRENKVNSTKVACSNGNKEAGVPAWLVVLEQYVTTPSEASIVHYIHIGRCILACLSAFVNGLIQHIMMQYITWRPASYLDDLVDLEVLEGWIQRHPLGKKYKLTWVKDLEKSRMIYICIRKQLSTTIYLIILHT